MIPLIDASPRRVPELAAECGFDRFGQLQTPLTGYSLSGHIWAADNGCYSRFDPEKYLRFLARRSVGLGTCLWATVPDAVGDARLTRERWDTWSGRIHDLGYPLAYVLQDGVHHGEVPWNEIVAVFIGGTTEWKLEKGPLWVKAAKKQGKWVHVGRINTGGRYLLFARCGADSFDGSGLARPYPGFDTQRRGIASARSQFLSEQGVVVPTVDATGSTPVGAGSAGGGSQVCGS